MTHAPPAAPCGHIRSKQHAGIGTAWGWQGPKAAPEACDIGPQSSPRTVTDGRERPDGARCLARTGRGVTTPAAARMSPSDHVGRCRQVAERQAKRWPWIDSLTPIPRKQPIRRSVKACPMVPRPMTAAHFVPTTGEVRLHEPWNPARWTGKDR